LIAGALSGLIASILHFAFPMASSMNATHSLKEMQSFFNRINKVVVLLATLGFIPFIVMGDKFIALWINQDLALENQTVLCMLLVAFYLNTCFTTGLNAFIVGIGRLKYFTVYAIIRSIVLFIGFLVLIKFFGINGAGLSYLCSLLIDLIYVFFSLKNVLKFSIISSMRQSFLVPFIIGIVLGSILFFAKQWITSWITLIIAFSAFGLLYLLFAFFFGVIDEKERNAMLSVLKIK
jgi:O-antigen/teichoic acid export membrane protein